MPLPEIEYEELALSLLPPCLYLDEVLLCVREHQLASLHAGPNVRVVWESFAARGLIPDDWLDAPNRGFQRGSTPSTVAEAAALASSVRAILTVEELAREAQSRLVPWGVPKTTSVLWLSSEHFGSHALWPSSPIVLVLGYLRYLKDFPTDAFAQQVKQTQAAMKRTPLIKSEVFSMAMTTALYHWLWCYAAEAGWEVTNQGLFGEIPGVSKEICGLPFRALPDPFAPLLGIWREGYALIAIKESAITLLFTL